MKAQYGPEEMLYPNKQLYRYNIRNGDEIIIDSKLNRFVSTSSTTSSIRSWRRFSSESSDDTKHTWQLLGSCWPPVKSEWDIEISIADQLYVEKLGIFLYITHTPNNCSRKYTYRFFRVEKGLIMIRLKGAFVREKWLREKV